MSSFLTFTTEILTKSPFKVIAPRTRGKIGCHISYPVTPEPFTQPLQIIVDSFHDFSATHKK